MKEKKYWEDTMSYFGEQTPKLGFGLMRLPKTADGGEDLEQVKKMVDIFMDAGFTYFDTAFVYDRGDSEKAVKECLVDRYPRDSFTLATKLNAWYAPMTEEEAKAQFQTSLERTGAGYFDYYLLHALKNESYHLYDDFHLWDFIREQKEQGLIKHIGFSFHGSSELLEQILNAHPEVEFVQIQYNYADLQNPKVEAEKCHEIICRHGKGIVIMEPIKGGSLAAPGPAVEKIFRQAAPAMSVASWAVRFAASADNIITVLSGMSNLAQMEDNVSYMKDFKPLTEAERNVIRAAQNVLANSDAIPCTACHYCTEGCPMQIPIPELFAIRNRLTFGDAEADVKAAYETAVTEDGRGRASECIQCGQCENACPQYLPIISLLEEIAGKLE